ncbi:MAG: hypothetical protein ACREQW_11895, partial [Candidatus Binatia bacterium]
VSASDFGSVGEAGFAAPFLVSQPNGPNTFPLEITRDTSDGRVRVLRRITGNSFVGPVPAGNATYDPVAGGAPGDADGQGCSSLGECGNCTNRTAHVLTRITNISPDNASLFAVRYVEAVDFDINGTFDDDRFGRTTDSVTAYEDVSDATGERSNGMLLQSLITPPTTGVFPCCDYEFSPPVNCDVIGGSDVTPILGDKEAVMRMFVTFGTFPFAKNASSGNNLRVHYRRY